MSDLPRGFTCECGEETKYSPWVYAHWDTELVYQCPKCKNVYNLIRGFAVKQNKRKRTKKR